MIGNSVVEWSVGDASGNAYPAPIDSSTRQVYPHLKKDVDGSWYGRARVPSDYGSGGSLVVSVMANATSGASRLNVHLAAVADAEDLDPTLTANTAQDITVPGTAYLRKDVTFTGLPTLAAGDVLLVRVQHDGAHANDTLAVDTVLVGATLTYTAA